VKLDPLARLEDLPIPSDVQPTRLWTGQMLEMAAHIGPHATLLLIDRLGGQAFRVPMDPGRNRMITIIGEPKARIMSRVYGGNHIQLPRGRAAVDEARRGPIIAAIRAGGLTIADGVAILRTTRTRLSWIVNHSDEGQEGPVWSPGIVPADTRQFDMFAPRDSAE